MFSLLDKVVLPSLISAQDFAYVEEAAGTYELLKFIERVLRYSLKQSEYDILENEIIVMVAILELFRYRFGTFQFNINYEEKYKLQEISRYELIYELDELLEEIINGVNKYSQLNLTIKYNKTLSKFELKMEENYA